jgi:hypothetical protein
MKSKLDEESHLLGTATTLHRPGRSDDLKERLETGVVVSAGFAAILALCVVMFVGLYNWSRYAPIFPPDAAGSPIEEAMPWSR